MSGLASSAAGFAVHAYKTLCVCGPVETWLLTMEGSQRAPFFSFFSTLMFWVWDSD